jgi:hypothetical protein
MSMAMFHGAFVGFRRKVAHKDPAKAAQLNKQTTRDVILRPP